LKNKLHILKSELPEEGQQLRPKDVGGLTNKSFVQQVGVKFYICLTEVYVIKDNINAFNKTLNKPSKAVPPCWIRIMRFCPYPHIVPYAFCSLLFLQRTEIASFCRIKLLVFITKENCILCQM